MNVLHILQTPNNGGREMLLLDIANSENLNFNLTIVLLKEGILLDRFKKSKAKLCTFKVKRTLDFNIILKLREIIKKENIDIIHAHEPVTLPYVFFATIFSRAKRYVTIHGYYKGFTKNNISLFLFLPFFNYVFGVSNYFAQYLRRHYLLNNNKVATIYNGISFKRIYYPQKHKNNISLITLGMVSHFVKGKDQLTVCNSLNLLDKNGVNFNFYFVGRRDENYDLYDKCVTYCQNHNLTNKVFFINNCSSVENYLRLFDIFIFSSVHDTFGIAVIEAMANKIPCILSDIPPMKEISDNGSTAVLFKTHDANDLSEKILLLSKDERLREYYVEKAYKYCLNYFTIEKHIKRLHEYYEKLI